MMQNTIKNAILNAGATAVYVVLISSFITNLEIIIGDNEPEDTILIPMVMLLLLVISAAITGFAVFGKPVMWYMDGKKKEALLLLAYTLSFLAITVIFFIFILLF
jgi:hypothetical protein